MIMTPSSLMAASVVAIYSLARKSLAFTTRSGAPTHWQPHPCTSCSLPLLRKCSSIYQKHTNVINHNRVHSSSLFNKKNVNSNDDEISKRNNRRRRKDNILPPTEFDDYYYEAMIDGGNATPKILESIYRFLIQPIPNLKLPLVYIIAILVAAAIVPPATFGLLVLFFGVYLSLGNSLIGDANDDYYEDTLLNDDARDEQNLLPLAAFTGAVASSALLSPQGLSAENQSTLSLTSTVGLGALGLAGVAVIMGLPGLKSDEQRLKEREIQDSIIRNEKNKMDQWDDELLKDNMPDNNIDKNE